MLRAILETFKKRQRLMKIQKKLEKYPGPIALFPIGISGSGKSFIFNKKQFKNWSVISADDLRKNYLMRLRRQKKYIYLNSKKEKPDPKNAAHIFHPALRQWVFKESQREISKFAKRQKNLILDLTNIHLQRVYAFNLLRKYNYTLIAVIFKPRTLQRHLSNVKQRANKGGIDLSPKGMHLPDKVRSRIILDQKNCMLCFLKNLKKGQCSYENLPFVPQKYLKTSERSFKKYLKSLPRGYSQKVKKLAQVDRVDDIVKLDVAKV